MTKKPHEMTTAELREKAEADGLRYYQQRAAQNPHDAQAQYELECYCNQRGIRLNPEVNRLYDMPKEDLKTEWEKSGKAVETAELEKYREGQAKIWMASQPGYTPSPDAAQKIVALVNKMGMQGSVADLQMAFDILCEKGELEAPAQPVPVYTREELSQMSAADCRRALEQMGFNTY
jgi:hypothetical protein